MTRSSTFLESMLYDVYGLFRHHHSRNELSVGYEIDQKHNVRLEPRYIFYCLHLPFTIFHKHIGVVINAISNNDMVIFLYAFHLDIEIMAFHKYEYPPNLRNPMQQSKLVAAPSRSSSMTDHIQRQPNPGACFITA